MSKAVAYLYLNTEHTKKAHGLSLICLLLFFFCAVDSRLNLKLYGKTYIQPTGN